MEFENAKKLIEKRLVEEIKNLDSSSLELVGHNVISVIESKNMIHHGLNKDYKPVKSTVDTFSDDSQIVGEYSTDQKYFEDSKTKKETMPKYEKIENDIDHALSHGPSVEKIYLITSMEEPPSFRSSFNSTTRASSHNDKIILIDARKLAKYVYKQSVDNPDYAAFYRQFFPEFSNNLDNYEYYGKVPGQCERFVSDKGVLQAIENHFLNTNICVLHGLSGAGKTQAVIDFIHHSKAKFENYIWVAGEDWNPDLSLSSIHRTRGGAPINISGVFNSFKTILIIDSLDWIVNSLQLNELTQGFERGSIILITSQLSDTGNPIYLEIPSVSIETAIGILGEDNSSISEDGYNFIQRCRFSPLILATTRKIIEQQGIDRISLYNEILNSPKDLPGKDGLSILKQVLSKLDDSTLNALKKVANSGCSVYDLKFLRRFIGILPCLRLQQFSILTSTNAPNIVKIHDLVCVAIREKVDYSEIANKIVTFIDENDGVMEPSLIRQIHLSYDQLSEEDKIRGERLPDWISYALLQVEGPVKQEIYQHFHSLEITYTLSLASIMCIIDSKEIHSYSIEDSDERNQYYKNCADKYGIAFEVFSSQKIKEELLHHQGKAFRRFGEYDNALKCFIDLLTLNVDLYAAHGQIAHLGTQWGVSKDIKLKGEESMEILIKSLIEIKPLPLRVALAGISRLRSYRSLSEKVLKNPRDVETLGEIIAMSALEKFGQFYEAFVAFTSIFSYHHGPICLELSETLSEMLMTPPEFVQKDQWTSACETLTNLAIVAQRENKNELANRLLKAGLMFADKINVGKSLKPFDARAIAKAYITAKQPEEALECINKVPVDKVDHWVLYRKGEAELESGKTEEALVTSMKALDAVLLDTKAVSRVSIYHDLKSQCHIAMNDNENAIKELNFAIEKCSDAKYKLVLEERLKNVAENLNPLSKS